MCVHVFEREREGGRGGREAGRECREVIVSRVVYIEEKRLKQLIHLST